MSDHKYTKDGKKVVVIGALNSKETIVQEIYIKDGSEIPAGEHFIVNTLLDSPYESYAVKEEKRLSESIAQKKNELNKIQEEINQFRAKSKAAMDAKLTWINGIKEDEIVKVIQTIRDVLCGEYTYVVFDDGYTPVIHEWNADLFVNTEHQHYNHLEKFESVRLVSLFGHWRDRLRLDWKVNRYQDGCGNDNKLFYPCKSYEEAIQKATEFIYSRDQLSDRHYEFCLKYNIPIQEEKNIARINMHNQYRLDQIEKAKQNIEKLQSELIIQEVK